MEKPTQRPLHRGRAARMLSASVLLLAATVLAGACTSSIPAVPENLSPEVNAEVAQGGETRFAWTPQEDVDYYDFHLFNRLDGDTEQYAQAELLPESVCVDDECSVTVAVDLPLDDAHAWRVRAVNGEGRSGWSRTVFAVVPAEG